MEGEDELIWAPAKHGIYSLKEGSLVLMDSEKPPICESWWSCIWKLKAPPKTRLLMWTILRNKILTGENLRKRYFHGPFLCCLCKTSSENIDHIFLMCPTIKNLWVTVRSHLPSLTHWQGSSIREAWSSWWSATSPPKDRNIPILTVGLFGWPATHTFWKTLPPIGLLSQSASYQITISFPMKEQTPLPNILPLKA